MTLIGQEYNRRAKAPVHLPKRLRIVGAEGHRWTATDAAEFGEVFAIEATDLAAFYAGAPATVPTEVNEDALRAPSADALSAAVRGYRGINGPDVAPDPDGAESPEMAFARIAREQAAAE
jgi:hypothetical protein